jgi:hypothetical protein
LLLRTLSLPDGLSKPTDNIQRRFVSNADSH